MLGRLRGKSGAGLSGRNRLDWFTPNGSIDDSELFFCVVHGRLEDRETVARDWAQSLLAGKRSEIASDPLPKAKDGSD